MSIHPEAPWKEATAFSLNDISTLLDKMSDKEKGYSLRARSSIRIVDGKKETIYVFFLRNGNESLIERLENWWNAKAQHALVRRLICEALSSLDAPASPGQSEVRTLAREKALLRVRKMEKMAPVIIREIVSECIEAQKTMQVFQHKLLTISAEDRLKFKKFDQEFHRPSVGAEIVQTVSMLSPETFLVKDPINDLLLESASHFAGALLDAFIEFIHAVAESRPIIETDLPMVLAFIDRWKTGKKTLSQTDIAGAAVTEGERMAACRAFIDTLIGVCDGLPPAAPMVSETLADGRMAIVPAPSRPVAARPVSPPQPAPLPVLPAGLFQSLLACGGRRSAGAVHAVSQALMPAMRSLARHTPLNVEAAAPARKPVRAATTTPILPAQSPQDISCDYQSELDVTDIDSKAVILIAYQGNLFSLSPACLRWTAELGEEQHAAEEHYSKVHYRGQTVLLARAARAPLGAHLDAAAIRRLGEAYDAAVRLAIAHGRPICLTNLFDDDPQTADQCVEAMLAPVRRCYREGMRPAIHIRVTSRRLQESVVAALKALLSTQPAERPAVEVVDCLSEADRQLPGLIMVSADSADPLNSAVARRHAQQAASARAGAAAASRVVPRKLLGSQARTHLYYVARPCPLKNGLPDGARIAGEYAALFHEARQHQCMLVMLEVLSETPGHEGATIAALSAAIMAARAVSPALKVRIVTRNRQIGDAMRAVF